MLTISFLNQTLWCDPHWIRLSETIPMSGNIIGFGWEIKKLAIWKLSILDLICCPDKGYIRTICRSLKLLRAFCWICLPYYMCLWSSAMDSVQIMKILNVVSLYIRVNLQSRPHQTYNSSTIWSSNTRGRLQRAVCISNSEADDIPPSKNTWCIGRNRHPSWAQTSWILAWQN